MTLSVYKAAITGNIIECFYELVDNSQDSFQFLASEFKISKFPSGHQCTITDQQRKKEGFERKKESKGDPQVILL